MSSDSTARNVGGSEPRSNESGGSVAATTPWDVVVLPDIIWATGEESARAGFVKAITDDPNLIRVSAYQGDLGTDVDDA